ncbi:MAG: hypothetical protein ACREC5_03990 [Thermoplasmata archaeon]
MIFFKCGIPPHLDEISSRHSSLLSAETASKNDGRALWGCHGRRGSFGFGPCVCRYHPQIMEYIQNASEAARSGPRPFQVYGSSPPSDCLVHRNVSSTGHLPK